jgi:hypothetical protein
VERRSVLSIPSSLEDTDYSLEMGRTSYLASLHRLSPSFTSSPLEIELQWK